MEAHWLPFIAEDMNIWWTSSLYIDNQINNFCVSQSGARTIPCSSITEDPCSFLIFPLAPWYFPLLLAPFSDFLLLPAPFSKFLCSMLPDYVFLAPCSLPYFRPCSLLPWVSRAILPAPWLPLTGVQYMYAMLYKLNFHIFLSWYFIMII